MKEVPQSFTQFKKKGLKGFCVHDIDDTKLNLGIFPLKLVSPIPAIEDFGFKEQIPLLFKGGETEALNQLKAFLSQVSSYKETRSNLDGGSKLSPWLSTGCLSHRKVYLTV
jgi:deoxyribodipyrimidine photo-lyase